MGPSGQLEIEGINFDSIFLNVFLKFIYKFRLKKYINMVGWISKIRIV